MKLYVDNTSSFPLALFLYWIKVVSTLGSQITFPYSGDEADYSVVLDIFLAPVVGNGNLQDFLIIWVIIIIIAFESSFFR